MARRPEPATAIAIDRDYTQVTHFADSATSPALSGDGRLVFSELTAGLHMQVISANNQRQSIKQSSLYCAMIVLPVLV